MELKEKIRSLRKAKNISKKTMAEELNMSEGAYGNLEKIELGTKLDIDRLEKIAKILGVEMQELLRNEPTHLICKQINHAQQNTNNNIGKDQSEFINHLKAQIEIQQQELQAKNQQIEALQKQNIELLTRIKP